MVLGEKRLNVIGEIGKMLHSHVERTDAQNKKEISHKIYFTQEQMASGSWGAILGARGSVHQQLEKETKCKIVLIGRGITNPLKDTNANAAAMAMEDPHARITAGNEHDLQVAA
uniref:Branchpoint-bridging protein n=1 Tax=Lygus hesperus TaxID=30085 RepID=A0A0A9WAQ2_LYGHE